GNSGHDIPPGLGAWEVQSIYEQTAKTARKKSANRQVFQLVMDVKNQPKITLKTPKQTPRGAFDRPLSNPKKTPDPLAQEIRRYSRNEYSTPST
ncbi:MAG: hypothetical protein ABFS42_12585, partial [Candidatus Krumholzibacteriota bacterium]